MVEFAARNSLILGNARGAPIKTYNSITGVIIVIDLDSMLSGCKFDRTGVMRQLMRGPVVYYRGAVDYEADAIVA